MGATRGDIPTLAQDLHGNVGCCDFTFLKFAYCEFPLRVYSCNPVLKLDFLPLMIWIIENFAYTVRRRVGLSHARNRRLQDAPVRAMRQV